MSASSLPQHGTIIVNLTRDDDTQPLGVRVLIHALTEISYPQARYDDLTAAEQRGIKRRAIYGWRGGLREVTEFARHRAAARLERILGSEPLMVELLGGPEKFSSLCDQIANEVVSVFEGAVIADNEPLTREGR